MGQFTDGEWFVVLVAAGTHWIGGSHPSGDLAEDGYIGNGAMLNPGGALVIDAPAVQGWDEYLTLSTGGGSASNWTYDPDLNIDPAQSGPHDLVENTSIVKPVRLEGISITPNAPWQTFAVYARLHDYITGGGRAGGVIEIRDAPRSIGPAKLDISGTKRKHPCNKMRAPA